MVSDAMIEKRVYDELPPGFKIDGAGNEAYDELPPGFTIDETEQKVASDPAPAEPAKQEMGTWDKIKAGAHELMTSMIPGMKSARDTLAQNEGIKRIDTAISKIAGKEVHSVYQPPQKSEEERRADAIRAKLENIETLYSDLVDMGKGALGDKNAKEAFSQKRQKMNEEIVGLLNDAGIEARMTPKGVMFKDSEGNLHKLDDISTIAEDIKASIGEMTGGVGGALLGARAGAAYAPGWTKAPAALIGSMIGAYLGSAGGKAVDVLRNAADLNKKLDTMDVVRPALDAGAASTVADATAAIGAKVIAPAAKAALKPAERLLRSDGTHAIRPVVEEAGRTMEEAYRVADEMNRLAKPEGKLGKREALDDAGLAMAMTEKSLTPDLEQAIAMSPKGAMNLSRTIEQRAEHLSKELKDNSLNPRELQKKIKGYEQEVNTFFNDVQQQWKDAFKGHSFRIDDIPVPEAKKVFKQLENVENPAINDVIEALKKDVQRQDVVDRLTALQNRIYGTHDIEDLLNLRKEIGAISRLPSVKAYKGQKALQAYLDAVDKKIEYMPIEAGYPKEIGDEMVKLFKKANKEYADMKSMQDGIAYKRIMRPGVGEKDVNKALIKLSESINDELESILGKLPQEDGTRAKAEISLLSSRVGKAIKETEKNRKAVDFSVLKESLDAINEDLLKTPEAKETLLTLRKLSDLFAHDYELQKIAGSVREKVTNNIATQLMGKIRMAMASRGFRIAQERLPGRRGAHLAYQATLARALERARTPEDFIVTIEKGEYFSPRETKNLRKMLDSYKREMDKVREAVAKKEAVKQADAKVGDDALTPSVTSDEIEALRANPPSAEEARAMERLGPQDRFATFAQDIRYIRDGRASDQQLRKYLEAKRSIDPKKLAEEIAKESMPKRIEDVVKEYPSIDYERFLKERLDADLRKEPYGFSVNKDVARRILDNKASPEELAKLSDDLAHVEADPQWAEHYGIGKVDGDVYVAPDGEKIDLNTVFSNPGSRMGTGFAGGTANVLENADQNDDGIITLDETASAFVKGFLAGAIAPDVIKAIGKTNPKLYTRVTEMLLDETADRSKQNLIGAFPLEQKYLHQKTGKLLESELLKEATELPNPIESFSDFKKLFKQENGKFYLDTPVKRVYVDANYAFKHLTKNTHYDDRTYLSGAFAETLKNPLFVVEVPYKNTHNTIFYKPFIDSDGIAHLASYTVDDKGKLVNKTFFKIHSKKKVLDMIKVPDSKLLYFKGASKK